MAMSQSLDLRNQKFKFVVFVLYFINQLNKIMEFFKSLC